MKNRLIAAGGGVRSDCGHNRATRGLAEAKEWLCLDYQCQHPGVRYLSWENWVKGAQDFSAFFLTTSSESTSTST